MDVFDVVEFLQVDSPPAIGLEVNFPRACVHAVTTETISSVAVIGCAGTAVLRVNGAHPGWLVEGHVGYF